MRADCQIPEGLAREQNRGEKSFARKQQQSKVLSSIKMNEETKPSVMGSQSSMVQVKIEEEQPSIGDYLDNMNQVGFREDGPSTGIHQHTMGKIKAEVGGEPSAVDLKESNDLVKIKDEEDLSLRSTCSSRDWLKIEVDQKPPENNFSDTVHVIKREDGGEPSAVVVQDFISQVKFEEEEEIEPQNLIPFSTLHKIKREDGEEPSAVVVQDFMSQVKVEEEEETKPQDLISFLKHEVKEEIFAYKPLEFAEREILESTTAENGAITKTENVQRSTRASANQSEKRHPAQDGTVKSTELENGPVQSHTSQMSCKCTTCGESFRDSSSLLSHQSCHVKSYPCTFCEMCFIQPTDLMTHMRIHIQEKVYKGSALEKCPSEKPVLTMQKRSHTGGRPVKCIDCKDSSAQSSEQCEHRNISYECTECMKILSNFYNLKKHQMIHSGEKPHRCTECNKAFREASTLKIHERIHTGEKPYQCTECQKSFRHLANLKYHQMQHTGEKPYQCTECQKSFRCLAKLKYHESYHTGKKSYKCKECKKSFRLYSSFKRHQKSHSEVKPYECKECKQAFRYHSALKMHERIHTGEKPYQCTECQKSFCRSTHLKLHQQTHTGEKPYECPKCKKTFRSYSYLQIHKRIHTG